MSRMPRVSLLALAGVNLLCGLLAGTLRQLIGCIMFVPLCEILYVVVVSSPTGSLSVPCVLYPITVEMWGTL